MRRILHRSTFSPWYCSQANWSLSPWLPRQRHDHQTNQRFNLDCYADADFADLFSTSNPDDPKSVKSRSGYVITLGQIPVSWGSKLQSETALSTMEAEYISLSQALRVLLPLRIALDEVSTFLHL